MIFGGGPAGTTARSRALPPPPGCAPGADGLPIGRAAGWWGAADDAAAGVEDVVVLVGVVGVVEPPGALGAPWVVALAGAGAWDAGPAAVAGEVAATPTARASNPNPTPPARVRSLRLISGKISRGMKRFKASVIGGSGYGGAEIIRRLLLHPEVQLVRVASVDFVGQPLGAAHPNLTGVTDLSFENLPPLDAAAGCNVVLLGLPHKVSAEVGAALLPTGVKIVDMSGDFRLRDPELYARYYGARHPHPQLLGRFVYGLPELNREAIMGAQAVASPGCFATTIELALLPLVRAGLLRGVVHIVGITGSSGSGVAPSAGTHHPVRAVNLKSYKLLEHQHTPEIEQTLADAGADPRRFQLRFVPVSAPLSRGILATCFVEVPAAQTREGIVALYQQSYGREPFVRFLKDRVPEVAAVAGSNYAEVGVTLGPPEGETRTLAIQAATDNLIKGGAGQAVQNMNIMLGLPETMSLEDPGGWP
jgi:LysW-gamma-L-alpha-aminoadipyl-6-phosphate/LysW-L-glutamyl-5-phosphate reductase